MKISHGACKGGDTTKPVKQKVHVDMKEVKKAEKKLKRIRRLLKEANSLADELASKGIKVNVYM